MRNVHVEDLGQIDYESAWNYQEKLFNEVVHRKLHNRNTVEADLVPQSHHLLFCEHPHVYTLGRSGKEQHLLADQNRLAALEATFYRNNRGGDITYHGPGQIVGYPILDLDEFFTDIHRYLRYLEESVIRTLSDYGIESGRLAGLTGVWLDPETPGRARKICALGVRCSRWVTMHGFAFNVNTDLSYFGHIIPCGIQDKAVTSMKNELGKEVDMESVKKCLVGHLTSVFDMTLI